MQPSVHVQAGSPHKQGKPMSPEWSLPALPRRDGQGMYHDAAVREPTGVKPPPYSTSAVVRCGGSEGLQRPATLTFARAPRPTIEAAARNGGGHSSKLVTQQERDGSSVENQAWQPHAAGARQRAELPDIASDSPPLRGTISRMRLERGEVAHRVSPLKQRRDAETFVRKLLSKAEPLLFMHALHPEDVQQMLAHASASTADHVTALQHPIGYDLARDVAEELVREIQADCA